MWVFDNSSCHNAYSDDALLASRMNAKPGGKQPVLRDTMCNGQAQKMVFSIGVPKGLIQILKERHCYVPGMKLEEMRKVISSHTEFADEKTKLKQFLQILDTFALCSQSSIVNSIRLSAAGVRLRDISELILIIHFQHCNKISLLLLTRSQQRTFKITSGRHYMFAYVEGFKGGPDMEKQIIKYKKLYKSHRNWRQ